MRTIRLPARKVKRAKPSDLKTITRALKTASWVEHEARSLGFELTEKQVEEVSRRIKARTKRKNTLAIKTAKAAFEQAIREIKKKCLCGNQVIQAKTVSHHHSAPGPIVIGPGGGGVGYTSHEILFLFCTSCGLTYYNELVQQLSGRYARGEFDPKLEPEESNNTWYDDGFPSYR